jgi:hypothetical protein
VDEAGEVLGKSKTARAGRRQRDASIVISDPLAVSLMSCT